MSTVRRLNLEKNNRVYQIGDKLVRLSYDTERSRWFVYVNDDPEPLIDFAKSSGDAVIDFLDALEAYDLALENPKEGLMKVLADIYDDDIAKQIIEELEEIIGGVKED